MPARLRYEYGAGLSHVIGAAICVALSGYAAFELLSLAAVKSILIWFVGSILLHDLVFVPLYSAVAMAVGRVLGARTGGDAPGPKSPDRILALNALRVPALLSGLAFMVWFPLILQRGGVERITAHDTGGYLTSWLILTAVLFAISGLVALVRVNQRTGRVRSGGVAPPGEGADDEPDARG